LIARLRRFRTASGWPPSDVRPLVPGEPQIQDFLFRGGQAAADGLDELPVGDHLVWRRGRIGEFAQPVGTGGRRATPTSGGSVLASQIDHLVTGHEAQQPG